MWYQVWFAAEAAEKQDARFTWHQHLCNLLDVNAKCCKSFGPVAATISALLEVGWKPIRPDFWEVDKLTTVSLSIQPFTRLQITARATHDLQKKVWSQAAAHLHGKGLERGIPDFGAARRAVKYFRKNGLFAEAKALEYAVVGFSGSP